LVPTPYSVGQRGAIDVHLARERIKRNATVTMPYFSLAPYVLAESDLVFTTTRRFAEHYIRFLPLKMVRVALDFPTMQYYQLWHERSHHSDEIRWLRGLIAAAAESLGGVPGGSEDMLDRKPMRGSDSDTYADTEEM
jgi:DNA-binding transcriptional LysR family regulator